jgi:membrane protease YdiL (CAAX protease family)
MSGKNFQGWRDFGIAAAIFFASTIVAAIALMAAQMVAAAFGSELSRIGTMAVTYSVMFVGAIVGAGIFYSTRPGGRPMFSVKFRWNSSPMAIFGVVLISMTGVVLEPLLLLFPEHYFTDLADAVGSGVWPIVMTVVLAPVFEEIFFRGLVLEQLRRHIPSWQAVMASALFFGIVHLPNLPQALNAVVLAVVMGYIYVRTGSLAVVMVVHAVNNGLAYMQMETGNQNIGLREWISNDYVYWPVYALCVVLVAVSLAVMARNAATNDKKTLQGQLQKDEQKLSDTFRGRTFCPRFGGLQGVAQYVRRRTGGGARGQGGVARDGCRGGFSGRYHGCGQRPVGRKLRRPLGARPTQTSGGGAAVR